MKNALWNVAASVAVWLWKHSKQGRALRRWNESNRRITHEGRRQDFISRMDEHRRSR